MRHPAARAIGYLLLVAALAGALTVRWTTPEGVEDLRPRPDALGYETVARNLAAGRGYVLDVGGRDYPPMHPPGFPSLLAVWFSLRDEGLGGGIRVVSACAAATVLAVFAIGSTAGGPLAGGAAALLLATSPLHARWSRAVMSDVPATAAVAFASWAIVAALRRGAGVGPWLAIGAAIGLASAIRVPCGLLAPAAAAVLCLEDQPGRARARRIAALVAGLVAGVTPLLVYQHQLYGAPWRDAPSVWATGPAFGTTITLAERGAGVDSNLSFYARLVAGLGDLYAWPAGVLLVIGSVLGLRGDPAARRIVLLAATFTGALLALHVPLAWQWGRYFLLPLPLLVAVAGLPLGRGDLGRAWQTAAWALTIAAAALPARSPEAYAPPDPPTHEVAALRALDAAIEPDAALMASTTTILFDHVLRRAGDRVLVPLGLDEMQAAVLAHDVAPLRPSPRRAWLRPVLHARHDARELERRLATVLAEGRPVYFAAPIGDPRAPALEVRRKLEGAYVFEPRALDARWELFRVQRAGGRAPGGPSGEDGAALGRTEGRARGALLATTRHPAPSLRTRDATPAEAGNRRPACPRAACERAPGNAR